MPLTGYMLAGFNAAYYTGIGEKTKRLLQIRTAQELLDTGWVWESHKKFLTRPDVSYMVTLDMLSYAGQVIDWNDYVFKNIGGGRQFSRLPNNWCIEMFIDWNPGVPAGSGCNHEYVNVSFNQIVMACKHCGKSEPGKLTAPAEY